LKLPVWPNYKAVGLVAPFTGAWIETPQHSSHQDSDQPVAPFTGAWIET